MTEEQKAAFAAELTQLSQKYGIIVEGCGCCGSPFLLANTKPGKYELHKDDLRWEESEGK